MKHFSFFLTSFILLSVNLVSQVPIINGWSVFTASSDTRIIYVSNSGNDATAITYTKTDPDVGSNPFLPGNVKAFKTIAAAKTKLRAGFPDWILIKRGETFTNQSFGVVNLYGRKSNEPMLISSYGSDTLRPKILTGVSSFIEFTGASASHVAIVGLMLEPHTRTGSDEPIGINFVNTKCNYFLVEDCSFTKYFIHFLMQDYSSASILPLRNFNARRNTLTNAYKIGGGGHAVYMHRVDSILFEDNLIDHNGWSEVAPLAPATAFSHNTYFQSSCKNLIFRNNIVSRASAVGGGFRCGGLIYNNLFLSNPRNILIGSFDQGQINWPTVGVSAKVYDNVILDARPEPSFPDFGSGISIERVRNAEVNNNIIAHFTPSSTYNVAISMNKIDNINTHHNKIYNWVNNKNSGLEFSTGILVGSEVIANCVIASNELQFTKTQAYCAATYNTSSAVNFNSNVYHNVLADNKWFEQGTLTNWITYSHETNAVRKLIKYVAPDRNIASYLTSIGKNGGLAAFIANRMAIHKSNWSASIEANTVNNYIRDGFKIITTKTRDQSVDQVSIYPNPVVDQIMISGLSNDTNFISLYDVQGQLIHATVLSADQNYISVRDLNPGIYFLRIKTGSASGYMQKMFVKN